ncbi:MAG: phytoene desaturase family protein [Planctomycetota bacterium]
MNDTPHTVVIGSGLAGLSAACTLAARGRRVTLLEKNPWLGGKAAVLNQDGYRFDMGPTILTMPRVLKRVFEEAGRDIADYLDLRRLDPQWRCFFDDSIGGGVLDLREQVTDMQAHLREQGNGHGQQLANAYGDFIKYTERLHRISDDFFFWKSVGGIGDIFDVSNTFNLSTLSDVLAMRMGSSVATTIRKYVDDPRLAQLLDHFVQYVGSSPMGAPAILCSIASMQVNEGVWYPIGGTRAVPEALAKLGGELGVDFRTEADVEGIDVEAGRVAAVRTTDGERIACDSVVSNMDAVRTHRELIGGPLAEKFNARRRYEPACSGVVLYLGLKERYEHVAHHNFVFSRDPEEEFDAIYHDGDPAPDPTCYLACPSHTETDVAPAGGEALYVLVHTPFMRSHHDWSPDGELFTTYRQTILDKLKRTAGMEDIEDRIATEAHLTPQGIHDRYRVLNGAIYGLASHGKWTGAFKPANHSTDVDGLYLAGGAAHPGPGMPMVLMSGWIAADTLDQREAKGASNAELAAASA